MEYMQLLGYVNIYVGDLIEIWDTKVKKHFFKPKKSKNDLNIINHWRKRDFYTEYMIKKYEKMELITREGIMKPRILDYAEVILNVENKLRPLSKLNLLNRNTIKNYVKMHCRNLKIPTSIVGEELMTQEVDGILNLWKSYFKISRDIVALERRYELGKITKEEYESKHFSLEEIRKEMFSTIQAQIEELERYKEIQIKYNEVQTDGNDNKARSDGVKGKEKSKQEEIKGNIDRDWETFLF